MKTPGKIYPAAGTLFLLALICLSASAQDINIDLEKTSERDIDTSADKDEEKNESEPEQSFDSFDDNTFDSFDDNSAKYTLKGFVQYEGLLSTYTKQETREAFKKNELSGSLDFKYGTPGFYIQADTRLYILPGIISENLSPGWRYSDDFSFRRDLSVTSPNAELEFRELYVNYDYKNFRFRAGNQLYHWGTADVFNHTSYFNPYDMREFLFKDGGDGLKSGVPSISALGTIGSDSIEIVLVPVHAPSRLPLMDSYWGIKYKEGPFPVIIDEPRAMDIGLNGIGAGIRYYTNFKGYDIHASLYHGPDREPAMRPDRTISNPGDPVSILIIPEYEPLNIAGIAVSNVYKRFIFQFEGIYSPDKTGVIARDINSADIGDLLPFEKRKSHFAAYSAGFNYFVPVKEWFPSHSGECLFTIEWSQSYFFDDRLMKPMLTDTLVARIQDNFFTGKLETSLTGILNTSGRSLIIMPRIAYRLDSGVSIQVIYAHISSGEGNYFSGYGDNDFISWRIRYEF